MRSSRPADGGTQWQQPTSLSTNRTSVIDAYNNCSPPQDVVEEMEGEYGKERDAIKAAAKELGLQVGC